MRRFLTALTWLAALGPVHAAHAQEEHAIQLALLNPVQIFPEADAIRGVRVSLLYGKNSDFSGFDIGTVNHTTGSFVGVQFGLVGVADGGFQGWQYNLVNVTGGQFEGLQTGFVSLVEAGRGVQWSGFNHARNFRGLQFAFVNYAERLNGVQVGLINIIREGGVLPVLPIVNWSFEDD